MTFTSNLENLSIIDDWNAHKYVSEIVDPATPYSGGYASRNYGVFNYGFSAPKYTGKVIPRSEWDSHIKRQEEEKSSPDHWHIAGNVPILDQNGLGYCWIYGTVGAIMTAYAQTGMDAPHLSATGPGAQGKNWRNQGGWAGEAIGYIHKYGIPTLDVWPEHSMDRSLPGRHEVQLSAKMHNVVDFEELPRNSFDHLASALLDPQNPRPVTLGLNWWGHLIFATKLVKIGPGRYGVLIVNSWKESWERNGKAVLTESKATAHEQIVVKRVQLRVAA